MKKTLSALCNSKGDISYIDTAITSFVIMLVIAFALNIFSFLTLKQDMEYMCEQMIIEAALDGRTDTAVSERLPELCSELNFKATAVSVDFSGSEFIKGSKVKVQYGSVINIKISYKTTLGGIGFLSVPITVMCSSSGLSEHYWK